VAHEVPPLDAPPLHHLCTKLYTSAPAVCVEPNLDIGYVRVAVVARTTDASTAAGTPLNSVASQHKCPVPNLYPPPLSATHHLPDMQHCLWLHAPPPPCLRMLCWDMVLLHGSYQPAALCRPAAHGCHTVSRLSTRPSPVPAKQLIRLPKPYQSEPSYKLVTAGPSLVRPVIGQHIVPKRPIPTRKSTPHAASTNKEPSIRTAAAVGLARQFQTAQPDRRCCTPPLTTSVCT
jgi:hypothetical protein